MSAVPLPVWWRARHRALPYVRSLGLVLSKALVHRAPPVVIVALALSMRRSPHIPYVDIPGAISKLAYLPDIHPAPVVPDFHFVVLTDPEQPTTLLQHHLFAWTNRPFPQLLPMICPHAEGHVVAPVIDNLDSAT